MKQETMPVVGNANKATQEGGKRGATLLVVAFLLGLGLGWFIFGYVVPARNAKLSEGDQPLVLAGKNSIAIDDQLFGDSVIVKSINLNADSWLAIHEDLNGKPGNILGAAWFPQGSSSGAIELQRATTDGATYYAMLHTDKQIRGEDGHRVFDYKVDMPMTDDTGNPLMVKFMTTATPAGQ